jgi:hypothetical protein
LPHEGSDIDLALISDRFTDDLFANLRQYAKINIRYPLIETHPFSFRQFAEGDEFLNHILKQGIEIKLSPIQEELAISVENAKKRIVNPK